MVSIYLVGYAELSPRSTRLHFDGSDRRLVVLAQMVLRPLQGHPNNSSSTLLLSSDGWLDHHLEGILGASRLGELCGVTLFNATLDSRLTPFCSSLRSYFARSLSSGTTSCVLHIYTATPALLVVKFVLHFSFCFVMSSSPASAPPTSSFSPSPPPTSEERQNEPFRVVRSSSGTTVRPSHSFGASP